MSEVRRTAVGSWLSSFVSAAGVMEAVVCRAWGYTELYARGPGEIPVDGETVKELDATADAPYRLGDRQARPCGGLSMNLSWVLNPRHEPAARTVLELGIEIGDLDHVLQIDAPSSVWAFLARTNGRYCRPGRLSKCRWRRKGKNRFTSATAVGQLARRTVFSSASQSHEVSSRKARPAHGACCRAADCNNRMLR